MSGLGCSLRIAKLFNGSWGLVCQNPRLAKIPGVTDDGWVVLHSSSTREKLLKWFDSLRALTTVHQVEKIPVVERTTSSWAEEDDAALEEFCGEDNQ